MKLEPLQDTGGGKQPSNQHKNAGLLYKIWVKNKEVRKRKLEEEVQKLDRLNKYANRHTTLKKYELMKQKHDDLEKKYKVLNTYNAKFLKDYLSYYSKEGNEELFESLKEISHRYVTLPVKELSSPKFNVFSPLFNSSKSRAIKLFGSKTEESLSEIKLCQSVADNNLNSSTNNNTSSHKHLKIASSFIGNTEFMQSHLKSSRQQLPPVKISPAVKALRYENKFMKHKISLIRKNMHP